LSPAYDAARAEIEAWVPIAAIVVPNGYHRLDARVFHALRAHLERLSRLPDLRRILVSHHEVIDRDPARVLADVAATL
jgi:hypothetical protein